MGNSVLISGVWSPPLNDAAHSSSGRPFIENLWRDLISKKRTPRIDGVYFTPNALPHIRDTLQHLDLLDEHCVRLLIGETGDDSQAVVELAVEVNVNVDPEPIAQHVGGAQGAIDNNTNVGATGVVNAACNHFGY